MKTRLAIFLSISLAIFVSGCAANSGAPRKDAGSQTGYYIPRDLDDSLTEVERIMGTKGHADVLKAAEDGMINYHFGLGLWMRNNWGLWSGSRLAQYFVQLGIKHPDDMSAIILDSYWRKLHGRPIDLEGQVRHYQDYWKKEVSQQGAAELCPTSDFGFRISAFLRPSDFGLRTFISTRPPT